MMASSGDPETQSPAAILDVEMKPHSNKRVRQLSTTSETDYGQKTGRPVELTNNGSQHAPHRRSRTTSIEGKSRFVHTFGIHAIYANFCATCNSLDRGVSANILSENRTSSRGPMERGT